MDYLLWHCLNFKCIFENKSQGTLIPFESKLKNQCMQSVACLITAWKVSKYGVISVFSLNAEKYGPEITPYLDTFHAVQYILGIREKRNKEMF